MQLIKNSTAKHTATIGFFDGVHRGHRFVIDQLKQAAAETNSQCLVLSFDKHPRRVLQADFQPKLLTTLPEKLELLGATGIDACALLNFTPEMARLSAFEFMHYILKERFNVNRLLIGYDHRFGNKKNETFDDYRHYGERLGIELLELAQFSTLESEHISSSEIRRALLAGQIEYANKLLGYAYFLEGRVVDGYKIGRKINFPTANLQAVDPDKLIPGLGVYAVKVHFKGKIYGGMLNIGKRPTLANGDDTSIEVHIFNFDNIIYDESLQVEFLRKIRDEKKFENIEELTEQLKKDRLIALN